MADEDKRKDRMRIPIFKGDRDKYQVFKIRFGQWEESKEIAYISMRDRTADLPTMVEIDQGTWLRRDPDPPGLMVDTPLTDDDKKRYKDNAMAMSKLTQCVSDELLTPLMTAAGDRKSVWHVKQWLETNYAEVSAEDSLQELQAQLRDCRPSDYEEAMFYLAKLEDINSRMARVGANYQLDE